MIMKDSGVEWLGDIPAHWKIISLKFLFKEHKCKNTGLQEKNLLSLSYGKIIRKNINTNEGLLPESFETYNIIEKGCIVFRLTDLQNDKHSLRTGLCKERGIITSAYLTIETTENDNAEFMHYLFHVYDVCKVFYNMGDGVRQSIKFNEMKNLSVILPPLEEQKEISAYLDKKCAAIDSAVDAAKKLVVKFGEYKKALITETVTKGLNRAAKMKDSGVEWLGDIPAHWNFGRLKNLLTLQRGFDLPSEKFIVGDFPIYGSSGLMGYHCQKTSNSPNIVIGRSGSTGKLHYIEKDFWAHNTGIFISDKKGNYCKYLYYLLNIVDMDSLSTKTAVPTLDRKKIQEYRLPYTTDLKEQKEIASYLDKKCAAIDENIEKHRQLAEKLTEYKKSLIYEVVTGKMEV